MTQRETELRKPGSETARHSQQAKQKNHVQNSTQDINHPPVFTTKPGLASQHIDAWEMLTSCWDQCSGLLWSSQGCVVSTELFWRFRWGRDQGIFMCGVFSFHPANPLGMTPSRHTPGPPLPPPSCTGISSL